MLALKSTLAASGSLFCKCRIPLSISADAGCAGTVAEACDDQQVQAENAIASAANKNLPVLEWLRQEGELHGRIGV